ncbi:hypothetical protein [Spirochaeta isovalerica]|uniref:MobA-like NTP transferase domain-containing protein n=1 Tax=Spirochaeta isovalerica TaxID=150 RepID=A0A841RII6_9SPIO|nr:hypothetical protein [Spirochaeta isovalerica]MBB6482549.1 hypothetical protein [Spirochaeta isovalerica]
MISAVLLAGYNNKRAVEQYRRIVESDYGERFIEKGYKPLHEFSVSINGETVSKPLLQFTLEVLLADDQISDIVIVGHKERIEGRLDKVLAGAGKPLRIIDQRDPIPVEAAEALKVNRKETPPQSVGDNVIKGYWASRSGSEKQPALFAASDSPFTSMDFINRFLANCASLSGDPAIVMPAIYTDPVKDNLGRTPLLLINDTEYTIPEKKDRYGRNGFRLSSILYANPFRFDVNMTNVMYSMRKALNPKTQMKIFRIGREVGYPGIYSRYFLKKTLSIRQCEAICTAFFKGPFTSLPMHDIKSTYDFDGTEREYIEISRMLEQQKP